MGQVDPSMYVQSGTSKAVWKTPGEIPSGTDFTRAFAAKQEILMKGQARVKVFATICTKLCPNTIKFENK
eukprot:12901421-Ditylum_brightwellii.AAC.1